MKFKDLFDEEFEKSQSDLKIKTLEDLRLFVDAEARKSTDENHLVEARNRIDEVINRYSLSADERIYVCRNILSEEQSNTKTLINSTKAKEILLKRKK
ncbi:MAG: hypothetical protein MR739_00845 [Spirochaetia bacterium]|nr:hypothetical protein [Spirochaetia bacterium]